MNRSYQTGFTLIELLITVVVLGILVALAAPSMSKILDSRRLKGAVEEAYATFNFAKSEAIKRNNNVRVYFVGTGATWCYGLKAVDDDPDDDTCDCTETVTTDDEFCEIDGAKKIVNQDDFADKISVANGAAPFAGLASFDGVRGTTTAGNIEFQMSDGRKAKVTVSVLGRVRVCSDDGVGGYEAC